MEHAGESCAGKSVIQLSDGAEMEACGDQTASVRNKFS